MATGSSPLDLITIPIPCQVSWDDMAGDDRVRFCARCRQRVYNLSAMSRASAEQLLQRPDGVPCLRLYRRPDGTVLTRNCLAALGAFPGKLAAGSVLAATLVLGVLASVGGFSEETCEARAGQFNLRSVEPFRTLLNWLNPPAPTRTMGKVLPVPPRGPGPTPGRGKPGPQAPAPAAE